MFSCDGCNSSFYCLSVPVILSLLSLLCVCAWQIKSIKASKQTWSVGRALGAHGPWQCRPTSSVVILTLFLSADMPACVSESGVPTLSADDDGQPYTDDREYSIWKSLYRKCRNSIRRETVPVKHSSWKETNISRYLVVQVFFHEIIPRYVWSMCHCEVEWLYDCGFVCLDLALRVSNYGFHESCFEQKLIFHWTNSFTNLDKRIQLYSTCNLSSNKSVHSKRSVFETQREIALLACTLVAFYSYIFHGNWLNFVPLVTNKTPNFIIIWSRLTWKYELSFSIQQHYSLMKYKCMHIYVWALPPYAYKSEIENWKVKRKWKIAKWKYSSQNTTYIGFYLIIDPRRTLS